MRNLTTDKLRDMMKNNDDLAVINVLGQDSYRKGHIAGSVNVPGDDDEFLAKVGKVAGNPKNEVVVYCANEECDASPKAAKRLESAGFQNVYDYEGGMKAWKEAGLPVESSEAKVS